MNETGPVGAGTPPPMPSRLDELAGSLSLPRDIVERLRSVVEASDVACLRRRGRDGG